MMREDQEAALFGDGGEALDRQGFGSVEEHAYIDIPKSHASSASVRCEEDQAREDEAETAASGGAEERHGDEEDAEMGDAEPRPLEPRDVLAGLSQLGRTATGERTAYLTLSLNGKLAADCQALAKHRHLQNVILRRMGLTSLAGLENMPHLTALDVSSNALTEVPGIDPPPRLLRSACFSDNSIASLGDLSPLRLLQSLDLSGNALRSLEGIGSLPCLQHLDVSRNALDLCDGLDGLCESLESLSLADNRLAALDPLAELTALTRLDVSGNALASVAPIGALSRLRSLDVARNALATPEALVPLTSLGLLQSLVVEGNPLCDFEVLSRHVLYLLPQLSTLDGAAVAPEDKVLAANSRGADIEQLEAIRKRLIPSGELDDFGGTVAPVCVTLQGADDPGPTDEGLDVLAAACPAETVLRGLHAVCEYLADLSKDDEVRLLRAAYAWVLSVVQAPPREDAWVARVPLFRPHLAAAEGEILGSTKGAWAEKVAKLLALILIQFGMQAHVVHGFIKPLGSIPGAKLRLPNHVWNAVRANGTWRLLDAAWAAIPGSRMDFFTRPQHFIYTHMPLARRWQLLPEPITVERFWAMPQLAPAFFPLGIQIPDQVPSETPTGTATLRLPMPSHITPFPQLLELPGMQEVTPHPPGTRGVPPGSYIFAEVAPGTDRDAPMVTWEVTARLPEAGKDYCIRIMASAAGSPAVEVMMVRVSAPDGGPDVGRVLPNFHSQWLRSKCTLLSPLPSVAVRKGAPVDFQLVVPGAVGGVAVGEPGGYAFELLEKRPGDEYVGRVAVAPDADSFVVTTHSLDNPGIYMPLLKWHLKDSTHSPFHSRATSPIRSQQRP